ncbi:MAG: hypothetical protein IJ272_10020 [Clostridia bacterium]|nr:hypothetical protein [Clostridia bacterium]
MTKEEKKQEERRLLLNDAYRIFFDANDYDHDVLIGYSRLVREILGEETDITICDIILYQLIKTCQAFKPATYLALQYRFGLTGEQPMSYSNIGKLLFCSSDSASNLCKQAISKLRNHTLAKKYNVKVRKHYMCLPESFPINNHISVLQLSVRTHNALSRAGITTVPDFLKLSIDDIKKIRHLGDRSIAEIIEKQKAFSQTINQSD